MDPALGSEFLKKSWYVFLNDNANICSFFPFFIAVSIIIINVAQDYSLINEWRRKDVTVIIKWENVTKCKEDRWDVIVIIVGSADNQKRTRPYTWQPLSLTHRLRCPRQKKIWNWNLLLRILVLRHRHVSARFHH